MLRNPVYALCVFLLCTGLVISEGNFQQSESKPLTNQKKVENSAPPTSDHTTITALPVKQTSSEHTEYTPSKENTTLSSSPVTTTNPSNQSTPELPTTHSSPQTPITSTVTQPTTHFSPTSPPLPPSSTQIPVTPSPPPKIGTWNITEGNQTCIIIKGQFQIHAKFEDKKLNKTEDIVANVPEFAKATGNCDGKIILSWATNNTLEFDFMKNVSEKNYFIHGIHINLETASKLGPIPPINKADLHQYQTPLNQSYSCGATREIKLDDKGSKLVLEQFHLQAFKLSNGHGFDESLSCIGGTTADIVPIIVGCVLALLVISVLVAYLISRRRSQTRGYLSM